MDGLVFLLTLISTWSSLCSAKSLQCILMNYKMNSSHTMELLSLFQPFFSCFVVCISLVNLFAFVPWRVMTWTTQCTWTDLLKWSWIWLYHCYGYVHWWSCQKQEESILQNGLVTRGKTLCSKKVLCLWPAVLHLCKGTPFPTTFPDSNSNSDDTYSSCNCKRTPFLTTFLLDG